MVDPLGGEQFLGAVLAQALAQALEIDHVQRLVLAEAGKHHRVFPGLGVHVVLQALGANLLHHALHGRIDRADGHVPGLQEVRQDRVARLGDGPHHDVGADGDDAVDLVQGDGRGAELAGAVSRDGLDDVAGKGQVAGAVRLEPRRLVAAPDDGIGGGLDLFHLVAVLDQFIGREINHLGPRRTQRLADREQHRVAEPAAGQQHLLAARRLGGGAGRAHEHHRLARLQKRAEVA